MKLEKANSFSRFIHRQKPKFIFIPIPKSAYTSIIFALLKAFPDLEGLRNNEVLLPREHDEYFDFAFVRHPLDRVISCYLDKCIKSTAIYLSQAVMPKPQLCQRLLYNAVIGNAPEKPAFETADYAEVYRTLSGLDFASFLSYLPILVRQERHYTPQASVLAGYPSPRSGRFIGHLETIETDWRYVCSRLGRDMALTRENRTDDFPLGMAARPTVDEVKLVGEIYRCDFEQFQYAT